VSSKAQILRIAKALTLYFGSDITLTNGILPVIDLLNKLIDEDLREELIILPAAQCGSSINIVAGESLSEPNPAIIAVSNESPSVENISLDHTIVLVSRRAYELGAVTEPELRKFLVIVEEKVSYPILTSFEQKYRLLTLLDTACALRATARMVSQRVRRFGRKLYESSLTTDPHVSLAALVELCQDQMILTSARDRYSQVFGCSRFLLTDWKSHVAVHTRVYGGTEASAPKRATLSYSAAQASTISRSVPSFDPFASGLRHAFAMLAIDAMRNIGILDSKVRPIMTRLGVLSAHRL